MRLVSTVYLAIVVSGVSSTMVGAQARADPRPPVPLRVRNAAGCYQVIPARALTESPPTSSDSTGQSLLTELPARFRLTDTALAAPLDGWYVLEPATIYPQQKLFATWRSAAPDSVEGGWSTGFSGLALRLLLRGDSLTGVVERVSDARPRGYSPLNRPIRAVRIRCER